MPLRHGIEVRVTNKALEPLVEYGSQTLGRNAVLSKIVSTRIEAKDGLQFYIRIKPQFPFPLTEADLLAESEFRVKKPRSSTQAPPLDRDEYLLRHQRRFNEKAPIEELAKYEEDKLPDLTLATKHPTRATSGVSQSNSSNASKSAVERPERRASGNRSTRSSSSTSAFDPIRRPVDLGSQKSRLPAFPPFDLTASVYIDGHEKPECRQVIYLNPSHPKFYPGGFIFKGRWVAPPPPSTDSDISQNPIASPQSGSSTSSQDAHIAIRNWGFQSIPLTMDTLTDRFMTICSMSESTNSSAAATESDSDRLLNDLTSSLSSHTDMLSAEHRPKPGQIEVRVRRIVAGTANSMTPFKAYHYAGADETIDPSSTYTGSANDEDPSHTTSLHPQLDSCTGKEEKIKLNTVSWRPYRRNEDVYAKFVFNYSGREKLVLMGLSDEMGKPTLAGRLPEPYSSTRLMRKRAAMDGGDRYDAQDDEKEERFETTPAEIGTSGGRADVVRSVAGRRLRSAKRRISDTGSKDATETKAQQEQ